MNLISVLLPTRNSGDYLRLAIDSILNQSFVDFELLIIDDGSSDSSVSELESIRDERLRIVRSAESRGIAYRLNQGIELARGKYIARMDGDDISLPNRLAYQVKFLEENPEVDLCATAYQVIDADGSKGKVVLTPSDHKAICRRPWLGIPMGHPTWMGRAEWFKGNRYKYPAPYCSEDQELLLRSYKQSRFAALPEVHLLYRRINPQPMGKLLKTRIALFREQVRYFSTNRRYHFAALSLLACCARIFRDQTKWQR
jgi:glycosyltransferase involved in cell wall biosynthesis